MDSTAKWSWFYSEAISNLKLEQRRGQAYFNALHTVDCDLANSLRGTEFDPFYSDGPLQDFITKVSLAWDFADCA